VALTYQWFRGKTAIKGATAITYVLQAADATTTIRVAVTGAKAGFGTVVKTSAATDAVTAIDKIIAGKPRITGTARVGKTVKASAGSWGPGEVKLTYRWYHAGRAIKGATKSSYKLKAADKGHTISVKITGRRTGFISATAKASIKVK